MPGNQVRAFPSVPRRARGCCGFARLVEKSLATCTAWMQQGDARSNQGPVASLNASFRAHMLAHDSQMMFGNVTAPEVLSRSNAPASNLRILGSSTAKEECGNALSYKRMTRTEARWVFSRAPMSAPRAERGFVTGMEK